jgi:hypothetical protein
MDDGTMQVPGGGALWPGTNSRGGRYGGGQLRSARGWGMAGSLEHISGCLAAAAGQQSSRADGSTPARSECCAQCRCSACCAALVSVVVLASTTSWAARDSSASGKASRATVWDVHSCCLVVQCLCAPRQPRLAVLREWAPRQRLALLVSSSVTPHCDPGRLQAAAACPAMRTCRQSQ